MPRMDKIDKICQFFNVPRSALMDEEESDEHSYYKDDEVRDMAQFMFDNPDYRVLFDATRKVKKEDIQIVKEIIDRFSND